MLTLFAGLAGHAAEAATLDYSDVDVVSVQPRSPNLKPIVLVIFRDAGKNKMPSGGPEQHTPKQPLERR
jgi:hypothetical protein